MFDTLQMLHPSSGAHGMRSALSLVPRRYGVKYPALYASGSDANANAFNCVQRGHQNSLEQLPHFMIVFAAAAIKVGT